MKITGRIDRTGFISFGDANLSIWEDPKGPRPIHGEWQREFKRAVFGRIVQQLHRLGWNVAMPPIKPHDVKNYGGNVARQSAERHRICSKGDLKGELEISGRTIKFEMWQGINTPTRPDHGGRYESNKEACMPYLLRLEMERTRRRICQYLTNVFTGYSFDVKRRSIYRKPMQYTALEIINQHYADSWHFKGDWAAILANESVPEGYRKTADGVILDHGQRVFFFDRKGRIQAGTAMYNINNMWWVVTGRYSYTNEACFYLYAKLPENPRVKRNVSLRRKRLENLLSSAVKSMNFERAAVLRDLLFPNREPLFAVFHEDHKAFHRTGFSGYANDIIDAGKFTSSEIKGWDRAPNKIIPLEVAA